MATRTGQWKMAEAIELEREKWLSIWCSTCSIQNFCIQFIFCCVRRSLLLWIAPCVLFTARTLKNGLPPLAKLWRDSKAEQDFLKDKQKLFLKWIEKEKGGKVDFKLKLKPNCNIHCYKQHLDSLWWQHVLTTAENFCIQLVWNAKHPKCKMWKQKNKTKPKVTSKPDNGRQDRNHYIFVVFFKIHLIGISL